MDLVWDGERAWVVEVNPRPTASLETIDAAYGVRPFAAHVEALRAAACRPRRPPAEPRAAAGKAVVYATRGRRGFPTRAAGQTAAIRDVPHPGEAIAAGHPVCTLIATGPTPEAVLADLEDRAAALRAELHDHAAVDAVA